MNVILEHVDINKSCIIAAILHAHTNFTFRFCVFLGVAGIILEQNCVVSWHFYNIHIKSPGTLQGITYVHVYTCIILYVHVYIYVRTCTYVCYKQLWPKTACLFFKISDLLYNWLTSFVTINLCIYTWPVLLRSTVNDHFNLLACHPPLVGMTSVSAVYVCLH